MRPFFTIAVLFFFVACQSDQKQAIPKEAPIAETIQAHTFYVGTYTDGESEGIYKYALSDKGKLNQLGLVANTNNPSFLTRSKDGKYLIAVNEIVNESKSGTVESYQITKDSLAFINRSSSGGAHPCFVTSNDAGFILTANYSGGNVGLLRINESGELSRLLSIQQHSGNGKHERQEAPHAHSAWFEKDGEHIISVDLGTNGLWFSKLDQAEEKFVLSTDKRIQMAPAAGPRHLTFHPNNKWIYVVNELNGTVTLVIKSDDGKYKNGATVSTLPNEFTGDNYCADIHISSNGKFLYASNRGHNSLVIYEVNQDNGALTTIGHESVKGDWPRNFSLSPDENYLLVANQKSNNIVSFKRDKQTGLLTFVAEVKAPTPVCILF